MDTRRNLAAIMLPVCLALAPFQASAVESGVDGASAGFDPGGITSTALDTLACAGVRIPATGSVWHCVATCSAEVSHISGLDVDGRLAITRNGVEVVGTDRKFELNDNAGVNDPENKEVSTTGLMANLGSGTHTICCAAAKVVSGDPNFNVNDSSITAACSDFIL